MKFLKNSESEEFKNNFKKTPKASRYRNFNCDKNSKITLEYIILEGDS